MRSAVSMLSLISTGMPCSGPRTRPAFRSASSSSAMRSASGFRSITELIAGPPLSIASMRAQVLLGDGPRGVLARPHALLNGCHRRLLELERRLL
jgi:hypothetical protein